MSHVLPAFQEEAFNCPHCNAYAHMTWSQLFTPCGGGSISETTTYQAVCQRCRQPSIWLCTLSAQEILGNRLASFGGAELEEQPQGILLHPISATAPMPNPDLPKDCVQDYMEARAIEAQSPRAAAALLRLVVEKLCHQLGDPSKDIHQNIGLLVQRGLPERVQPALDSVRIIGNAAVHPGIMDIEDKSATVATLFKLVNFIVEKLITEPKEIDAVFESLPESRRQGIANRDRPKS